LSLGKVALSTSTTWRPDSAREMAAAHPAGPPPTTTTSARLDEDIERRVRVRRLGRPTPEVDRVPETG
jgi:hypothetical protein